MEYDDDAGPDDAFQAWLDVLETDVIQGEFGYERGEFTVFPSCWHPLYAGGLTPQQAWQRGLDELGAAIEERERQKAENWKRISASLHVS